MSIIVKPLITEKLTVMNEQRGNCYGFCVAPSANKPTIKKAIEEIYKVTVEAVYTINYRGKQRKRYTKSGIISGRQTSFKKAIVILKKGERIDFFSNI
ncbi:MAG: 50S ribosomal protein L23 [Tannerellaceae bacterium]|jgi:large subunit ribosomal protein L23|nr:50S ribosomal protein L23 [Tannerellaceae bacterium]